MTKEELIEKLRIIEKNNSDKELAHVEADNLLLQFIDDEDIKLAFDEIDKWYA